MALPRIVYEDNLAQLVQLRVPAGDSIVVSNDKTTKKSGVNALKIAIGRLRLPNHGVFITLPAPKNLTGYAVWGFWYYGANKGTTKVWLCAPDEANRFQYTFNDNWTGWKNVAFPLATNTKVGAPQWANVRRIVFQWTIPVGAQLAGTLWLDAITFVPPTPLPAPTTGTLIGTVLGTGNVPLAGVLVTAMAGKTATTSASGQYTIAALPPGEKTVTFSKAGYQTATVSATIAVGATTTLNKTLVAGTTSNATMWALGIAAALIVYMSYTKSRQH